MAESVKFQMRMIADRRTKLHIAADWRDLSAAAYLWKYGGERIADDLDQMDRVRETIREGGAMTDKAIQSDVLREALTLGLIKMRAPYYAQYGITDEHRRIMETGAKE